MENHENSRPRGGLRASQLRIGPVLNQSSAFMFILTVATVLVAVLCGMLWHDQPANGRENDRRSDAKKSHE